jgi:hypothetical protein
MKIKTIIKLNFLILLAGKSYALNPLSPECQALSELSKSFDASNLSCQQTTKESDNISSQLTNLTKKITSFKATQIKKFGKKCVTSLETKGSGKSCKIATKIQRQIFSKLQQFKKDHNSLTNQINSKLIQKTESCEKQQQLADSLSKLQAGCLLPKSATPICDSTEPLSGEVKWNSQYVEIINISSEYPSRKICGSWKIIRTDDSGGAIHSLKLSSDGTYVYSYYYKFKAYNLGICDVSYLDRVEVGTFTINNNNLVLQSRVLRKKDQCSSSKPPEELFDETPVIHEFRMHQAVLGNSYDYSGDDIPLPTSWNGLVLITDHNPKWMADRLRDSEDRSYIQFYRE